MRGARAFKYPIISYVKTSIVELNHIVTVKSMFVMLTVSLSRQFRRSQAHLSSAM